MFTKSSYIKRKLRSLSLNIFNNIENNGNCVFDSNGESTFINNLFDLFEKSDKRIVIFDIGANVGMYSEMVKKKALELNIDISLHLFEPTESCFAIISQKFNNDNFILNNFGVSDSTGIASIYYDKEQSGLASLYQRDLESYNLELNKSEEVKLIRLDSYIEERKISHINFVKIDIEGHELKAFEGFGKYINSDFIVFIQFEYGGANLDSHTSLMEIYKFFKERDFQIAKVLSNGLEIRNYSPFMDNFNYSNYVAISNKVLQN